MITGGTMDTIKNTPIIQKSDTVILGGGLKQVAAAVCLAKQGRRILILTKDTYLLGDLCCGNRNIEPFFEIENAILR
jgi:ribulose 1,5-bisphosphate synthetase/thiazole synthase